MGVNPVAVVLYGYAAFVFGVGTLAACVSLFVGEATRRQDAYRVFKLILLTGTGSGGIVATALQLHQAGLV